MSGVLADKVRSAVHRFRHDTMLHSFRALLTGIAILTTGSAFAALDDLDWLEGHWSGTTEQATLEEKWLAPSNGTMVAAVRMHSPAGTAMVEIIVISENDGSLEFNLQQFSPALTPRTDVQFMNLVSLGKHTVSFAAPDQNKTEGLLGVTYTRNADVLTIDVRLAEGNAFTAKLNLVE